MRLTFPATVFALIVALWIKAVYPPSSGIADADFFWHIQYGLWILAHGHLPAGDIFSWSMPGAPYVLTQWLGETCMGSAYAWAGLHGTKLLSVALSAITITASWMAARRFIHTSMALGLALTCNLIALVSPMRPQLFTFALLACVSWIAAEWITGGRRRMIYALPPLMALWANLHGGYVMGVGFLVLWCIGAWIEAWRNGQLSRKEHRTLTWIVVASAGATLLTPYGIEAWKSVVMISGLRSSTVISEWQPVNLTTEIGWFYLLNLVPFIALLCAGHRPKPAYSLIGGAFLVFGYLANRQVAICASVMAPVIAAGFSESKPYLKMMDRFENPSKPAVFIFVTLCLVGAFPWIQRVGDLSWERTIDGQYPAAATRFLKDNQLTERVLSDTSDASWLIKEGISVYIDGRMDLYKDRFFFEYHLASRGVEGWDRWLDAQQPSALLLRNDMALRQLTLASGAWRLVYEDGRYSVLVRSSHSTLPAISPRKIDYLDPTGRMIRNYSP